MKTMKKVFAVVLSIAMLVTGLYLSPAEAKEVQAAAETSTDGSYITLTKAEADGLDKDENGAPLYTGYVFAGWYKNKDCTLENAATKEEIASATHAKFVKRDTLSVKFQIANTSVTETSESGTINANSAIRFISSVDSLNYSEIGFRVTYFEENEQTNELEEKTAGTFDDKFVYERIASKIKNSAGETVEYKYSPKIVGMKSAYFFTAKLAVTDASRDYIAQAYWKTIDGTYVYGDERCVSVNDDAKTIINIPVTVNNNAVLDAAKTYTASFTSKANTSATAVTVSGASVELLTSEAGYANVRITLTTTDVEKLASATAISIYEGETVVASGICRNHTTTYSGAGTQDTSWYDACSNDTEFIIATSADLYGLAAKGINFSGKTIYMIADIRINAGHPELNADNTATWYAYDAEGKVTTNTVTPSYSWTSIPSFAGTFDGCMNTISGINQITTLTGTSGRRKGMFSITADTTVICNFKLVDSYIKCAAPQVGTVVGYGQGGRLDTVYSDALLVGSDGYVGGLVGMTKNFTVDNCWYKGKVINTFSGQGNTGGIVGGTFEGTLTINNCLNSATVDITASTKTATMGGGILGVAVKGTVVTITDSLNTGDVKTGESKYYAGILVGCVNGSTVTSNASYGMGNERIIGWLQNNGSTPGKFYITYYYNNAWVENEDRSASSPKPLWTGVNAIQLKEDEAYTGDDAVTHMQGFDFTNTWSVVPEKTPILKSFADMQ